MVRARASEERAARMARRTRRGQREGEERDMTAPHTRGEERKEG